MLIVSLKMVCVNQNRFPHYCVRGVETHQGAEMTYEYCIFSLTETHSSPQCFVASVLFHSFVGEVCGHLSANSEPALLRVLSSWAAQPQLEAPTRPHAVTGWNPLGHSLLTFN